MKGHKAGLPGEAQAVLNGAGAAKHLYGAGGSWWRLCYQRMQTRRVLRQLSDEELKDVGLSRAQALREAWRPFWL